MSKPAKVVIILFSIAAIGIIIGIFYGKDIREYDEIVVGTYTESNMKITLNNNGTFTFYNSFSGSSKGKYSYTLSDDKKFAYVTLSVESGSCSYTGGKICNIQGILYFIPKLGNSEVPERAMRKAG